MTKRRLFYWSGLALVLVVVVILAVPESRYWIWSELSDEPFIEERPVGYWIANLQNGDVPARRQAAIYLAESGVCDKSANQEAECQRVIAALVDGFGDEDLLVRKCAATSFLLYPKEAPVPSDGERVARMLGALTDEEVAVRRAAARALWQAGRPAQPGDAVVRLTDALGDKDEFVRMYAARALAKFGPDAGAAVPALLQRLKSDDASDVRKLAAKALGLIGPKSVGASLPDTVQALAQSLKAKNPGLREYAARALGELDGAEAISALRDAERDSDESVRAAARDALKRLERSKAP